MGHGLAEEQCWGQLHSAQWRDRSRRRAIAAARVGFFLGRLNRKVQLYRSRRVRAAQHEIERFTARDFQVRLRSVRDVAEGGYREQKYPEGGDQFHREPTKPHLYRCRCATMSCSWLRRKTIPLANALHKCADFDTVIVLIVRTSWLATCKVKKTCNKRYIICRGARATRHQNLGDLNVEVDFVVGRSSAGDDGL